MNVTAVRRWQWMLVGLLAGAAIGYVRELSANFYDELATAGARRIGQREFEQALVRELHGKPHFCNVVVSPHRLAGAGTRAMTVHVVWGLYWDGREEPENGRMAAHWKPAYFVASTPYLTDDPSTGPREYENVVAYLRAPRATAAIAFEYSQWWWAGRPLVVWSCAGFAFVGILWPTIVNLLVFGTWLRPRGAKALSLWRVKPSPVAPAPPPGQVVANMMATEALDREMESVINEIASDPPPVAPPPTNVRALTGKSAAPAVAVGEAPPPKDFGAEREDFYPTELRVKRTR